MFKYAYDMDETYAVYGVVVDVYSGINLTTLSWANDGDIELEYDEVIMEEE
jgi:hypothetical protein